QTSVRVSKRAGAAIGLVAIGLLLSFAYGGYRRQIRAQAAEHDSSLPKAVQPATASAKEVEKDIPRQCHAGSKQSESVADSRHRKVRNATGFIMWLRSSDWPA